MTYSTKTPKHRNSINYDDNVMIVTDKNFEQVTNKYEIVFLKFYAPWCPHCQKLAPKWQKLAREYLQTKTIVSFGEVNGETENSTADSFKIENYPTLVLLYGGRSFTFEGENTTSDIRNFVDDILKIKSTLIDFNSMNQVFTNFFSVVYFGSKNEKWRMFSSTVNEHPKIKFYHTFDKRMKEKNEGHSLTIFKNFGKEQYDFIGEWSADNIDKFIQENSSKSTKSLEDNSSLDYILKQKKQVIVLFADNFENRNGTQDPFFKNADKFSSEVQFLKGSLNSRNTQELLNLIGIETFKDPSIGRLVAIRPADEDNLDRYDFDGKFTENEVSKWINQFLKNKLKRELRTENLPKKTFDKGQVVTLVGKNFFQKVEHNKRHSFIKFYAPWCPHCNKLRPVFSRLAWKYRKDEQLYFAEIDGERNEIDGVEYDSYPTILYFPPDGSMQYQEYQGEMNYEDIEKFIIKKVSRKEDFSNQTKPKRLISKQLN